ncbi:MAG: PP2C family protein-serine/threonine phosphatase [Candidatus Aquicultorales bacterium]
MSIIRKVALIAVMALLIGVISWLDQITGIFPDLTVLYLIPIVIATAYTGMVSGFILALVAAAAELSSNLRLGFPLNTEVGVDALFHLVAFMLSVYAADRLLTQLKTIRMFEEERVRDINIAKELHKEVLAPYSRHFRDLTISSRLIPAKDLAGDYYHIAKAGTRLFVCIGDISGKSIAAALFSTLLNESLTAALTHSASLPEILSRVNDQLYGALPEVTFVTLFCAMIGDRSIDYVNAGHEPPLIFHSREHSVTLLESGQHLPLGISDVLEANTETLPFGKGDTFLAVTDGITESAEFKDKPFAKLAGVLRENAGSTPDRIVEAVFAKAMRNVEHLTDDATAICIKRY